MSVETFGPAAVQARIAEIQGRFASAPAAATAVSTPRHDRHRRGQPRHRRRRRSRRHRGGLQPRVAGDFAAALARLNEAAPADDRRPRRPSGRAPP